MFADCMLKADKAYVKSGQGKQKKHLVLSDTRLRCPTNLVAMGDQRMVSDQQRDSEQGVREVSSALFNRVTNYHAQIGANVNKETLQSLEWQLLSEAKALFHRKEYEESLNTFTHCLAVTEKTRSSRDATVRGAIVHNIASCLHHLGELEAAQVRRKRPHPPSAPIALPAAPAAVPTP